MRKTLLLIVMAAVALTGCSGGKNAARGKSVVLDGKEFAVAGLSIKAPGVWKDMGPSGMRAASYVFGPVKGDADSATVAVFYFGQGGGGAVEANFERWLGQMALPGGADPAQAARRSDATVDGMPFHHLEIAGVYNSGSMGGGMGGMGGMGGHAASGRAGYFMSAAVLEAPQGNVFFKLTGPEKTAREMNEAFLVMLEAARKVK